VDLCSRALIVDDLTLSKNVCIHRNILSQVKKSVARVAREVSLGFADERLFFRVSGVIYLCYVYPQS
jgi:hypothetical protein